MINATSAPASYMIQPAATVDALTGISALYTQLKF